jgi:hypothetical protein
MRCWGSVYWWWQGYQPYLPAVFYTSETLLFCFWYSFLLETELTPGSIAAGRIRYTDKIHWLNSLELPAFSIVHEPLRYRVLIPFPYNRVLFLNWCKPESESPEVGTYECSCFMFSQVNGKIHHTRINSYTRKWPTCQLLSLNENLHFLGTEPTLQ